MFTYFIGMNNNQDNYCHNIQGGNPSVSRSNWNIYLEILGFKEPEKKGGKSLELG